MFTFEQLIEQQKLAFEQQTQRFEQQNQRFERLMAGFRKIRKQQAETARQMAETDRQMKETDRKMKKLQEQVGGIGNNNGHYAEQYFVKALSRSKTFCGITYSEIGKSVHHSNERVEDEFDIVLYNGTSVAIVEVKYRIHPGDLQRLITSKVEHFRALFPQYANHKLYLGVAGMSFDKAVLKAAEEAGVAILERKDKGVESTAVNLKAY